MRTVLKRAAGVMLIISCLIGMPVVIACHYEHAPIGEAIISALVSIALGGIFISIVWLAVWLLMES